MKKKALALLMTAAMVATMAGCGDDTQTPANTDNSTAGDATTESTTESTTGDASADATTETTDVALTVWSPSEDQAEGNNWLQTMCEQFNEAHPEWNITFTYGVCPEGEAKATVTQDVEAAADVYMFANDNLTDLIAANGIAKLGGSTAEYVQNNMSQALVDSVTVDGSLYGVPFTSNTWFMYYNKSVLSEDDVKSLETMLEKGKVAFPLTDSWYIQAFYVANGCTLFGDGTDEAAGIDMSGDKAVAVTNYLVDLVANPNFVNDGSGEGLAGFADGSVVAMFTGSWNYDNIVAAIGEENVGAAQLPTINIDGEDKSLKAFFGSKAIGVNPNSDHMEVAVALAAYLGGEEAQKAHYEMRNILPTNTTVLADPAIAADVVAIASDACIANTSIMQPYCAAMNNWWNPAKDLGNALVAGEVTHDNAAEMTENFNTAVNSSVVE